MQDEKQETWQSHSYRIQTENYEGHRFRLHASVRIEPGNDSSAAHLWVRVDKEEGYGLLDNMMERPVRSTEWKKYTIEGKIDSGGRQLAFGVLCTYSGKFYFDDIKLDIETRQGKWTNVFNADFEDGKNPLVWVAGTPGHSKDYTAGIFNGVKAGETKSLVVEGKDDLSYRINKKAGKFANVNGIRIYYEVYGTGPPLVVLHGNGGSIENASAFYNGLKEKYQVIAVDSRGQGRSGDTEAPLTYDQMAADVNALLGQLKKDSVFIWGHSDGAIVALLLAMDYPVKVKKVLASGCNIQPDSLAVFPWAIAKSEEIVRQNTEENAVKLNKLMLEHPRIPYSKLSDIRAPVLLLAGDRDVIRPEHTLKIFQGIPNSQLCIIPGATHAAAWEKKELFMMIMDEFFNKPFIMPQTKAVSN